MFTTIKSIAANYAKMHPGFSLNFIQTPDRPSYLQKYETLAAANKLPDLFDADATPFTEKLVKQGRLEDVTTLLKDDGVYNNYRPAALTYQRFDDGSLYMIPLEYQLEVFWYNKALFSQAGVSVPTSLDQLPALCTALRAKGITPIAVDGQDQWPLERYMAYQPFRLAGPSYVTQLKQGQDAAEQPRRGKDRGLAQPTRLLEVLRDRVLVHRLFQRAGVVYIGQGSYLQHRNLGAGLARYKRAGPDGPQQCGLLHASDYGQLRHNGQRIRATVRDRDGGQREDV